VWCLQIRKIKFRTLGNLSNSKPAQKAAGQGEELANVGVSCAAAAGVVQHAPAAGRTGGDGLSECMQAAAAAQPTSVQGRHLCLQELLRGSSAVPAAAGVMAAPATASQLAAAVSAMAAAAGVAAPNLVRQ